ncbi:MAG TPA: GNAT family N-acetyltransferase [bacterium]|nr:GNAT family N-acetyltransferase [bacterium]
MSACTQSDRCAAANDTLTIRSATDSDKKFIGAMLAETNAFTSEETACALELLDIYLTNPRQTDYDFFCAVTPDNTPRGYVCYGKAPFTDAVFYLYWIAVHPDSQGTGVGHMLMLHLEKLLAAQNARMLLIETASKQTYENTRKFYLRNGFSEYSRIKDFYRVSDDRITYGKALPADTQTVIRTGIVRRTMS